MRHSRSNSGIFGGGSTRGTAASGFPLSMSSSQGGIGFGGGGGGGASMKWTDPTRLARFFDQDWAKASYGVHVNDKLGSEHFQQLTVSPYASLDLDRPRSALEASVSLMSQSGGGVSLTGGSNNPLTESGRDLTATYAPLSTMAVTTTSIPSLPDTEANAITRIPETDEQVGSKMANQTLRAARSTGDIKTQAVFKDSKFMFGFCSRQRAEILTPRSVPPPTDQLGRLSTCEERRNELFLNKSIKEAETMIRKAEGQKARRTMLMERKHKYLFEGDTHGNFKPSQEFLNEQKKRRHHAKRLQKIRKSRTKQLMAIENTQSRRGFDFIRDYRSSGQAPLTLSETKLTQTLGRVPGQHNESTWERLYVRDKKGINKARQQNLYNRNVGCKPHNIITGASLLIQPTEKPPKPRRDCHPSIVIHGMSQFGGK
jgi:hypothetical protein